MKRNKELEQKTMKLIEEKGIKPLPKFYFTLKNIIFWTLFAVSIIVISLAIGVTVYLLSSQDWQVHKYLGENLPEFFMLSIPYIWIAVAIVSLLVLVYTFGKTSQGYKFEVPAVVGLGSLLILVLASFAFFSGLSGRIHETLLSESNMYKSVIYDKYTVWSNAKNGLLGGKVISVEDSKDFTVKDFQDRVWQINSDGAEVPPNFSVQTGGMVKIIGQAENNSNTFDAKQINP